MKISCKMTSQATKLHVVEAWIYARREGDSLSLKTIYRNAYAEEEVLVSIGQVVDVKLPPATLSRSIETSSHSF